MQKIVNANYVFSIILNEILRTICKLNIGYVEKFIVCIGEQNYFSDLNLVLNTFITIK